MKQGRPPLQTAGGGGSRSIRCDAGMCVVAADQKFITSHLWHNVGGNLQLVLFFFRCRCHSLQHSQLPLRGRSCLFQLWGMMCGKLELGSKFHLHRGFQDFRIVMLDNWISRIEIHILGMIKVVRCGRLTWMELLYEELTWSSKITGMLFDHHKMNNSGPCEMFSHAIMQLHATNFAICACIMVQLYFCIFQISNAMMIWCDMCLRLVAVRWHGMIGFIHLVGWEIGWTFSQQTARWLQDFQPCLFTGGLQGTVIAHYELYFDMTWYCDILKYELSLLSLYIIIYCNILYIISLYQCVLVVCHWWSVITWSTWYCFCKWYVPTLHQSTMAA